MSSASVTPRSRPSWPAPVYICVRVRACSASTRAPASWHTSAIFTGSRISSFQPLRVFTVTGRCVALDDRPNDLGTSPRSRRQPEPPLRDHLLDRAAEVDVHEVRLEHVGHEGRRIGHGLRDGAEDLHADGALVGPKRSLLIVAGFSRRIPSADRNSVTTTSAPCARHRRRNGDSDTPAMGARTSGRE
jgi:hypothetical protein